MSTGDHPEVQAAKITARATRQAARLAACTALIVGCVAASCTASHNLPGITNREKIQETVALHPPRYTPPAQLPKVRLTTVQDGAFVYVLLTYMDSGSSVTLGTGPDTSLLDSYLKWVTVVEVATERIES